MMILGAVIPGMPHYCLHYRLLNANDVAEFKQGIWMLLIKDLRDFECVVGSRLIYWDFFLNYLFGLKRMFPKKERNYPVCSICVSEENGHAGLR